ncbi:TetR/AcrR family transcriptional regulator [Rhodococcus sp. SGAir0479]|uniref:TetR/AcrR family transcriptional regulator n=1 Tax=Rhodococcus sp. SGAir0479 TaxID=2567884 RepID=UPI0010CD560E|nr:TetR/AcrR family transcriptional regulator [Rhodococcus sp. SGAir0479]QCQ92831.1 TetR/AcrR family transcriptional regulator [Rhodococcus sp. SGAir0479]
MTDGREISTRREERKRMTRERLLDASRALFAENGFDQTTIDDIVTAARVSRGTFFNYFENKDAVLAALHRTHMDKLPGIIDDLLARDLTTAERIHSLFDDVVEAAVTLERYFRATTRELDRDLATPAQSAARTERFIVAFGRILEAGIPRGEVRRDYSLRFLSQMVTAVYVTTIRYWRQDTVRDMNVEFERAARFIAEAVAPPETGNPSGPMGGRFGPDGRSGS